MPGSQNMPTVDNESLPSLSERVAKNTTVVFLSQIVSLASNLGVTILFARQLGENGFGLFSYALVFAGLFAILADFGMKPILVREISRAQRFPAELVGSVAVIKVILCLATVFLTIVTARIIGYTRELFVVIAILAFNVLATAKLSTLRIVFEAPFYASLRLQVPMLAQIMDNLLLVAVTYWLVQTGADLHVLVMAYVLCSVPGFAVTVYAAVRKMRFRFFFNASIARYMFKESLPLWLYTVLMTAFSSIDVMMLKSIQGEAAVGLYSAPSRLLTPLLFVPNLVAASLSPLLARYHATSSEKSSLAFHIGMKVVILAALALAIGTTFLRQEITHLFFSDQYHASSEPLAILMWAQAVFFLNFFFIDVLVSMNQQRVTFYAAATMLITSGFFNWIFIQPFGIRGAAVAKLISSISGFVVLFIAVRKTVVLHLDQMLPRLATVGIAFTTGVALLSNFGFGISVIVSMAIFPVLVLMLGFFNKEERSVLKSMIPGILYNRRI
jgi:O-antigen/teichoic acid export membrane protein